MYFNENKKNTNIDNDFKQNKFNFNKWKTPIIILGIIIFLITIIIFIFQKKEITNYYLILNGEENITLYQGIDYIEPGYNAHNSKNEDLTNEVIIKSTLDTNKIGEYQITYTIGNIIKTRTITIVEKPKEYTYIYLKTVNNDINVYLNIGEKYTEPGYQVFSSTGLDLTNQVKITGNVDTSKKGTYKLIYSVIDSNNITITAERNIIVMDTEINLSLNKTSYVNTDINIKILITDNYFDYMILPNGEKTTKTNLSYPVSTNGKYTFTVYNKKGNKKESSIEVTNIDKTPPTGSCSGSYKEGISSINITANDNIGIDKYVINNTKYTSNKITINSEIKTANITIYDKVGNTKNITCNLKNNNPTYDLPITPTEENKNIIYNVSSNTLNVWIEKYSTYYISHIWAKEPYKQFKSAVPNNFGNELKKAEELLTNEIPKRKFENKIVIAINGSGFVLKDVYDPSYYNANPAWNKSSVSPIVIVDGNVLRNISSGKIPSGKHVTYGLKKDGNLGYYKYTAGTNLQSNIDTSQQIINDGVLYTFAFTPVIVVNGKSVSSETAANIRQGICQIDKNNFIFISNKSSKSAGFSMKTLSTLMVELGCTTGFNVDGGGSVSLLFKDKTNNINALINSSRPIADIIYFHE